MFRLLQVGVSICLCSCASDVANRYYSGQKYPPKKRDEVQILNSDPNRPYDVIAEFQARGETARGMQKRAAAIGADAVIITPLGGFYPLNSEWAADPRQSETYSRLVGTALRYK